MGFGLGLVIGLVLVSLAEALDTRVRHSDEVVQWLGLPLLTRIPIPPRSLRKAGSLGMLDDEGGLQTEAYRKLRINLDFANLQIKARTIMVTSASEQEGKSTTVGNLAVALARAGRRVVLVDLDLRKPYLDHFFDLTGRPGMTDVALGNVTLDQALWSIPVPGSDGGPQAGSLHVLPSGPMPPNPADLIESSVVSEVLLDLAERADVVLLDSAPLLPVSDGVVLSNKVDAMLIVVRATTVKRPVLAELQRVLASCPAAKLGFVLTGSDEGEGYGYGYGYAGYGSAAPAQARPVRARGPGHRPVRQRRRERAGAAAVAHAVPPVGPRPATQRASAVPSVDAPKRRWPPALAGGHREVQFRPARLEPGLGRTPTGAPQQQACANHADAGRGIQPQIGTGERQGVPTARDIAGDSGARASAARDDALDGSVLIIRRGGRVCRARTNRAH